MSGNSYFFLMLGILVVLVVLWALRRVLRSKIGEAGERAGAAVAEKQAAEHLDLYSRTAVLATDAAGARAVVEQVFGKHRRITAAGEDQWTLEFIEPQDIHLRLDTTASQPVLYVTQFREHNGQPIGGGDWRKIRTKVTQAAQSAGVPVTEGRIAHQRTHPADAQNWVWSVQQGA
ncbi:hypothetical protein IM660_12990 [Ruania alkalisoli]|uniref:Uncharacterized protein n=1 Tax=Ruania alkalisoli TaxID=2779775 RepID=A0A7M1SQ77_9MICO|nr:hypothetical protein [Ruania alkalisoli]QOR69591.1 hypothetical protein IM660_12990 [Ruania alkalisoli]